MSLRERFDAVVVRGDPKECWPWPGRRLPRGYGLLTVRKNYYAHRLAYEFARGPIPVGLEVCHECDNPPCCNPKHLFLGTHKQNGEDMARKGRSTIGTRNPMAKLTNEQVAEIRALRLRGLTQQAIADTYGVRHETISKIVLGKRWRAAQVRADR